MSQANKNFIIYVTNFLVLKLQKGVCEHPEWAQSEWKENYLPFSRIKTGTMVYQAGFNRFEMSGKNLIWSSRIYELTLQADRNKRFDLKKLTNVLDTQARSASRHLPRSRTQIAQKQSGKGYRVPGKSLLTARS